MCLPTHERYKTYQTGFSIERLNHAPGVGPWDTVGGGGGGGWGSFFSEIQPELVCELLTLMTHATANFFGPRPLGP